MSVRKEILAGRKCKAVGDIYGAEMRFEAALSQLNVFLPDDPAVAVMLDEVQYPALTASSGQTRQGN